MMDRRLGSRRYRLRLYVPEYGFNNTTHHLMQAPTPPGPPVSFPLALASRTSLVMQCSGVSVACGTHHLTIRCRSFQPPWRGSFPGLAEWT